MVIEGAVYKRHTDAIDAVSGKKMHPVIYAIVANGASWWIGVWLAKVIPNMF